MLAGIKNIGQAAKNIAKGVPTTMPAAPVKLGPKGPGPVRRAISAHPTLAKAGVVGTSTGFGYITSEEDASFGDRLLRGFAFGAGAGYAMRRLARPGAGSAIKQGFGDFAYATRLEQAGHGAATDIAMGGLSKIKGGLGAAIGKWNAGKAMGAGAFYGMIDDDVSVMEGMTAGLGLHAGIKMGARGISRGMKNAKAAGSVRGAFRGMAPIQAAAGIGMTAGVYGHMGEGQGAMGVASGAVKGLAVGGGGALFTKAVVAAPMLTLFGAGTAAYAGVTGAEAYGDWERGGRVGFNNMEADGDLALALHKVRHGH